MRTDPFVGLSAIGEAILSAETGPLISKNFGYDPRGELIRSEDLFSGIQLYEYDSLGRVTAARRPESHHTGRLRGSAPDLAERSSIERLFTEERFLYDPAGNLLSTGVGGDSSTGEALSGKRLEEARKRGELSVIHNRLKTIDDCLYRHDTRGRVVEKRDLERECRWFYSYDSDNRLIEVESNPLEYARRIWPPNMAKASSLVLSRFLSGRASRIFFIAWIASTGMRCGFPMLSLLPHPHTRGRGLLLLL
jgi:YD repeat-containing protein